MITYNPSKRVDEIWKAIRDVQNDDIDIYGTRDKKLKILKELREVIEFEYEQEVKDAAELQRSLEQEEKEMDLIDLIKVSDEEK